MAHCAKYAKSGTGHLTKHYERAKDSNGEYVKFGNEKIDTTQSHLNYNLAQEHNQVDFIRDRLDEVYCLNRADVKVMCSWVVTCPKSVPQEHEREFFQTVYNHLEEKYGKQNVISAYVHKDETTPHIHFAFIPTVYDMKKDREKVSAKEVLTKAELNCFHGNLQTVIDRWQEKNEYDFECNVLNGATENGNLTIQGLKAKELAELNENEQSILDELVEQNNEECMVYQEVQENVQSLSKDLEKLTEDITTLVNEKKALEGQITDLKGNEVSMFRKFIEIPQIKPIWEKFCEGVKNRLQEQKQESVKRADTKINSMSNWKEQIASMRSSVGTKEPKEKSKPKFDREDR